MDVARHLHRRPLAPELPEAPSIQPTVGGEDQGSPARRLPSWPARRVKPLAWLSAWEKCWYSTAAQTFITQPAPKGDNSASINSHQKLPIWEEGGREATSTFFPGAAHTSHQRRRRRRGTEEEEPLSSQTGGHYQAMFTAAQRRRFQHLEYSAAAISEGKIVYVPVFV